MLSIVGTELYGLVDETLKPMSCVSVLHIVGTLKNQLAVSTLDTWVYLCTTLYNLHEDLFNTVGMLYTVGILYFSEFGCLFQLLIA